jgi:branched-chain amino acid transport system substrate-binding protein
VTVHPRGARLRAVAVLVAAVAAVAAAGTAGCGGSGLGATTVNAGPIKIGLLVSLSGTYKAVGEDMRNGFQLYLDTHGGKLGEHEVELVVADEGDGADTARTGANKLIKDDRVVALAGIVGGGSVAAVKPLLDEAKLPLVGSNGRPTNMPDVDHVWHTSFLSTEPGLAMGEYVRSKIGDGVYAIGPDYQGGYDELQGFVDSYTRAGGRLANPNGKATFTPFPTTTNFEPYLAGIQQSGAKAVYCFYAGGAAIDFVKQYKQFGLAGKIPLYAAGFLTEGGVLKAQGDAAEGILNSLNYAADLDNPTNRAFVAAYRQKYNTAPTTYAMATYDAAAVLDKAIADIKGEVTAVAIESGLGRIGQIDSPRGSWQFSKQHTPIQKWYLRQVTKDGTALANVVTQELATLGD